MPLPPGHLLSQQNPKCFIILVLAYPGCLGRKAVKRVVVVVVVVVVAVVVVAVVVVLIVII